MQKSYLDENNQGYVTEWSFTEREGGRTCQSSSLLDVPRAVYCSPAKFPPTIVAMGSLKVTVLLKLEQDSKPVLLNLDVTQRSNAMRILRALAASGWIVLKGSTNVTPETERKSISSNNVLHTILRHVMEHGQYEETEYALRQADSSRWIRYENWDALLQGDGIAVIFTHHLEGSEEEEWAMEYDTAGRGEPSGVTATVDAAGTDIICVAGWLYFKPPAPKARDGSPMHVALSTLSWRNREG